MGTPLILKARAPAGSPELEPTSEDVTFLIPNVSLVEFRTELFCDTDVDNV
jgi:hypothetical protein